MDRFYLPPQIYFPFLFCSVLDLYNLYPKGPSPPSFQMDWASGEPIKRLKGAGGKTVVKGFIPCGSLTVGHHG